MPRNPVEKASVSWEDRYGTTVSGNIAQYIVGACIEDVIDIDLIRAQPGMDWVGLEDFHFYHIKCPYSIETDFPFVRDWNRNSPTYWMAIDVSGEATAHTATSGIMIRYSRGSKYGWLCVDPNCPYYNGTVSGAVVGTRYFYI
jgi:hypothetical protein